MFRTLSKSATIAALAALVLTDSAMAGEPKPIAAEPLTWRLHRELVFDPGLLFHCESRSTNVFRGILELWQAVVHPQHFFLIVHMDTGRKRQFWQDRRVHVGQAKFRMLRKNMPTAALAPFAIAFRCLVIRNNVIHAPCDLDCVRLPQSEGVYGPRGPMPA